MALLKPSRSDFFVTADIASNWGTLDNYPGNYICTSTTRPTNWGAAQQGMLISERDTGLTWRWDGALFQRTAPTGLLLTTSGVQAHAQRTTPGTTTVSSTTVIMLAVNNVIVPAGNRTLMVVATWASGWNTAAAWYGSINRSSTNGVGPITAFGTYGGTDGYHTTASTLIGWEPGGLPAGTYSWSLQFRSTVPYGGTTTISGDNYDPCELSVIEI